MKILVCISHVPDTTSRINFTDNNTKFDTTGVQFIIGPYDDYALARAIELKEGSGATVHVINVGLVDTEPTLRKALAIGADEAIRVNAEPTDSFFVASQIAAQSKAGNYDLILMREIEGGKEYLEVNLPFVAGCQEPIAEWKIPNMRGIMSARTKPLKVVEPVAADGGIKLSKFELPPPKGSVKMIPADNVGELVNLLKNEAKVL